jgi:CheY-like chemotaxis protein
MDATVKAHLFEPFYTTKERSHGTGLGLATVYGIVKQSGGFIRVDSEVGCGTTCEIFLPRVEDALDAITPSEEPSTSRNGTETILVAEDQPEVLAVALATLTRHGYTVLEGRDADEALEVATRHSGRIDLLITDVVMPGLNGRELADRLAAQRPNTRVLFTSGYTDRAIVERGVLEANLAFIAKPFAPADFLKKVREVLDACPDSGR